MDVYKKDEWELPRDRIVLGKEIGSGTFGKSLTLFELHERMDILILGKVYRGVGNGVKSVTGVVFGECAIKTVSEANANMDRFHFLIEASVMKQFNTNHIVKLYGIISDAPVLVVMVSTKNYQLVQLFSGIDGEGESQRFSSSSPTGI